MMSNIDQFNFWTARTLDYLYELFPFADEQVKVEEVYPEATDEDARIFLATAQFLHDEGFIRYDGTGGSWIKNARLTSKGFSVLHAIPDSISERATIYERLKSALKEGSTEALKVTVGKAISIGLAVAGITAS